MSLAIPGHLIQAAFARRPLPTRMSLPNGISILHDQDGIPVISAPDALGCAFGQGYVSAFHRLWSMEQQRRVAFARMSEVAGPATLDIDRWICRLGLKEAVEAGYEQVKNDPDTLALLEQYAAGVNHFIDSTSDWGMEFDLLNVRPESWSPKDTVAVLTLVSWSLAGNWEEQLVRMSTLAALDPEQAALLEVDAWSYLRSAERHSKTFSNGVRQAFEAFASLTEQLAAYQSMKQQAGLLPRRSGSNAWVVGGEYTASGRPVLAADPHMPLNLPGFFYEMQMAAEPDAFSVAGASLPGIPGVISGRNQHFAWSITIAGAITAELRVERDEPARRIIHTIAVKGQQPETLEVAWSERGPLLVGLQPETTSGLSLALEWTGHKGDDAGTLRALWQLNRARSVEDVRAAASVWGGPCVNLVWAEVEKELGMYGWRVAGRIPLRRSPAMGVLPAPAWEPNDLWAEGYIPSEQLPEEISPERGYVICANSRHAPYDYPFLISHEYMASYRAEQIERLVKAATAQAQAGGERYTVEVAQAIQTDQSSPSGLVLRDLILSAVAQSGAANAQNHEAIGLLRRWDGVLSARSAAAAILKVTEDHFYRLVAKRLFVASSPTHASAWLGIASTPINPSLMSHWRMREVIMQLIHCRPAGLRAIPAPMWDTLIQQAFNDALAELERLQGKNPALWQWGRLHQLELLHPLVQGPVWQRLPFQLRLLKRLFRLSRGPFAVGGDEHTICQTSSHPVPALAAAHPRRFGATAYQPAWRFIAVDSGRYYGCLPGGVSGHPNSRWSDNQLRNYLEGKYHARLIERSQ